MPTHKDIYARHAIEYEALVSREDYQGNILRTLQEIAPTQGLDVIDLGAGTGRLACLLAPSAGSVVAFDTSAHMLQIATKRLQRLRARRWMTAVADHRRLPLASASTDLIVSGWSISYLTNWCPDTWRDEAEAWLGEARRILRRGGEVVLFESLGTGNERPERLPHLENFYNWLDEKEFASKWIRTDYRFESADSADKLAGFFFGEEMRPKIKHGEEVTLPECTGVWWKRF